MKARPSRRFDLARALVVLLALTPGCRNPDPDATPEAATEAAARSANRARDAADETRQRLDEAQQTLGQR